MNSKTTIISLVAAVAVLSGAMGMSVTGTFSDLKIVEYSSLGASSGMGLIGHVEIEARHADGELYEYRQFDNKVVDDGEQCILKMLFATTDGTAGRGGYASTAGISGGGCTGVLTGAWDVIAIGTGTTAAGGSNPAETDVVLETESTANGGARGVATTKTWGNLTSGIPQIVMSKTFTATGGAIGAVTESGLFNSTTVDGSGMLARNVFSAVTLASGDSITITWTFKVGN